MSATTDVSDQVLALAAEFVALDVPDPWRSRFDAWAVERGLSKDVRHAVVVELLRQRIFRATAVGAANARRRSRR